MRGFWIEERLEWKIWKRKSIKFYFFKFLEKLLIRYSNSIVTLTYDAKEYIIKKYHISKEKIFVIPTCANLNLFKKNNNNFDKLTLIHLGAIGSRYNFEKFLLLYQELKKENDLKILIINKNENEFIKNKLKINNINDNEYKILSLDYNEVGKMLLGNSIGVFFPIEGFYLKGYFPTKMAEFLSSGLPIITHEINNHVNNIIKDNKIGITLKNSSTLNDEEIIKINLLIKNINEFKDKCSKVAEKYFSSNSGSKIYDIIYTKLTS